MSIAGKSPSDKSSPLIEMVENLDRFVQEAATKGTSLRGVEQEVFDRALKMGFMAVDQFLKLQGHGDLGEIVSADDGQELHRSAEPSPRLIRTIFGEHQFSAYVYRKRAHPNTPIVFRPIDARMSLSPSRWSHLLEEFTQLFSIEQAFAPAAKAFERVFKQRLSVDTLEEVNERMGQEAGEFMENLEMPHANEEGELLTLTCDGKGVPMVKEDAQRLRCFEERPQRPGNRRMATLAGVYSVNRFVRTPQQILEALFRDGGERRTPDATRPEPCHKRIIARLPRIVAEADETKPVSGSLLALCWANGEVIKRRRPGQTLVCLIDGQTSLWGDVALCMEHVPKDERLEILDIIHVSSYVWRAAKVFHSSREHQEAFVRERLGRILEGEVTSVIRGLRQMASLRRVKAEERTEIETVCGYFTTHADRMCYDKYLAAGCPIATGVIEGACRHLVKDRMERSGMRWTQTGAQAMLDVRAVHQSAYWDEFHQHRIDRQIESTKPYHALIGRLTQLAG
jgi:hypothetical protein